MSTGVHLQLSTPLWRNILTKGKYLKFCEETDTINFKFRD